MIMLSKIRPLEWFRAIGWPRFIGVAIFTFAGVYAAFVITVSGVIGTKKPEVSIFLWPFSSGALAASADQHLAKNPLEPLVKVETLAKESLKQQALNPRALRILGFYAEAKGQVENAENLIEKAADLSRRELGAQLWLIEAAARKNDTALTLKHYDIALSTKASAKALLYTRLLSAIGSKEVKSSLKPYMRSERLWTREFLTYAIEESDDLSSIVDLIAETSNIRSDDNSIELRLLSKLIVEQKYADARRLYLLLPGASAELLLSTAFNNPASQSSVNPLAWQLYDDPDAGGVFEQRSANDAPTLSLFASPWTHRRIASKLLYLDSRKYTFTARITQFSSGDGGLLRWQLRCLSRTNDIILTVQNNSSTPSATFTLPANCQAQSLEIFVSGGSGRSGLEASVEEVAISPVT